MKFQNGTHEVEGWQTISRTMRYEDRNLSVASVEVRTPSKPSGRKWTVALRKSAVVIAALTNENKLVLIREERVPVQAALWSVPAGQIDHDEELEEVARRELQEETGYEVASAGEMLSLGHFFTSPGFTDECGHFFLARPVELSARGAAHCESESILDCRAFTQREIAEMIARNEIRDANTLSICALLAARGYFSLDR